MQTLSMFLYLAPKCPRAPSLSPGLCSAPGPRDSGIVPSWVRTLKASGLLSLISSLNLSLWLFPLSCSASSCLLLSSSILPAARGSSSCLCANPPARERENAGTQGRTTDRAWGLRGAVLRSPCGGLWKHTVYFTSNSQIHRSTAPHR